MALASAPPPPVENSSRPVDGGLRWDPREGAVAYKVRRGTRPDFMSRNRTLRDFDVVATTEEAWFEDEESPPPGGVFYYVISSVDLRGRESFEPRTSGEW